MSMPIFRDLSPEEEKEFREWARVEYKPLSPISGVYHPVVQDECVKINREYNAALAADPRAPEDVMKEILGV